LQQALPYLISPATKGDAARILTATGHAVIPPFVSAEQQEKKRVLSSSLDSLFVFAAFFSLSGSP
jgi:hypothetical protein